MINYNNINSASDGKRAFDEERRRQEEKEKLRNLTMQHNLKSEELNVAQLQVSLDNKKLIEQILEDNKSSGKLNSATFWVGIATLVVSIIGSVYTVLSYYK